MHSFDGLYDHSEMTQIRFVGFHSEHARYDFCIIYTNRFFGKPIVIDMLTGKAVLVSPFELSNKEWLKKTFQIDHEDDVERMVHFFEEYIPSLPYEPQY